MPRRLIDANDLLTSLDSFDPDNGYGCSFGYEAYQGMRALFSDVKEMIENAQRIGVDTTTGCQEGRTANELTSEMITRALDIERQSMSHRFKRSAKKRMNQLIMFIIANVLALIAVLLVRGYI